MKTRIHNIGFDPIEVLVDQAHTICSEILLFEAVTMKEDEIRLILDSQNISDEHIQETYLNIVEEYDRQTGGRAV